jgi:exodeoxyribonuclease V alpha subunit
MNPLDLFFANLHAPTSESHRLFFAAVMQAARAGHLCLDLDSPFLDSALKIEVEKGISPSPYIHQEGRLFYLANNYVAETQILHALQRLILPVKPLDISPPSDLNVEQQAAFCLALSHPLTIIAGGPGTGKTYLTSHIVRAFHTTSAHIVLAAPTGKATARLKQFNPEAPCSTLHALLGIRSGATFAKGKSYIGADVIIVDESSMIDAQLFAFFLSSLRTGQRVIFLGDRHQLPPIESGSLFADLIDLLPTAHLRHSLRSDRAEILQLAEKIITGKPITPHRPLTRQFLLEQAFMHYQKPNASFCILSPLREGPFGVNALNKEIFEMFFSQLKPQELLAVPILITKTDYTKELYNGEMGMLFRSKERPLYAQFGARQIPASALPPYELAYVLSVHKSQGSEFDDVVIALPPGSEEFGREMVYTALTRAKHSALLCSDSETLAKTLHRSNQRVCGLRKRWES